MFTGIVEEKGKVAGLYLNGTSGKIVIRADKVLQGTVTGDSIAVNGVCLTVTDISADRFSADIMAETLRRSSLGNCRNGSEVNLERAMKADGRFGGHIVSGHIDGTGCISSVYREGNAVWVIIRTSPGIMKYIVEKGSVCIDGVSLTVAKVSAGNFGVSVIPHTGAVTILSGKNAGDIVNIENDIVGKYIGRLMGADGQRGNDEDDALINGQKSYKNCGITMEMLSLCDI